MEKNKSWLKTVYARGFNELCWVAFQKTSSVFRGVFFCHKFGPTDGENSVWVYIDELHSNYIVKEALSCGVV